MLSIWLKQNWLGIAGLILGIANIIVIYIHKKYNKRITVHSIFDYEIIDPIFNWINRLTVTIDDQRVTGSVTLLSLYVENNGNGDIRTESQEPIFNIRLKDAAKWYGANVYDASQVNCALSKDDHSQIDISFSLLRQNTGFFIFGLIDTDSPKIEINHSIYEVDPKVVIRQSGTKSRIKRYFGAMGLGLFAGGFLNLAEQIPNPTWSLSSWISWGFGTGIGGLIAYRYATGGPGSWKEPPLRVRRASKKLMQSSRQKIYESIIHK